MSNNIPDRNNKDNKITILGTELCRAGFDVNLAGFDTMRLYASHEYYQYIWVWAVNSGPYEIYVGNHILNGQAPYHTLFSDPHFNTDDHSTYAYPKMLNNNKLDVKALREKFELASTKYINQSTELYISPIGKELEGKEKFPDNGQYKTINNKNLSKKYSQYKEHSSPVYSDEFSIFAVSFGDENQPITKPRALIVQKIGRKTNLKKSVPHYHLEERNYILFEKNKLHLGMPLNKTHYYNSDTYNEFEKTNINSLNILENSTDKKETAIIRFHNNFYVDILNRSEFKNDQKPEFVITSGNSSAFSWSVDTSCHHLKTVVNIYGKMPPEIDVFDIVVTDTKKFTIPYEAVKAYSISTSLNRTTVAYQQRHYFADTKMAYFDNNKTLADAGNYKNSNIYNYRKLEQNTLYDFNIADLENLKWTFKDNINSQDCHPEFRVSFKSASSDRAPFNSMKVIYNDSPVMIGETVVKNFEAVQAYDKNGDFIQAFEVSLADKTQAGHYILSIGDNKIFLLDKYSKVVYSQMDRFSGNIKISKIDDSNENLPDFAKVKVRACDEYSWGKTRTYHILTSSQ